MSISAVLGSYSAQQDFGQLTSALAANDLAGARQALKSLKAASSGGNAFLELPLPTPIKVDLEDLSTALQKGHMEAAQTAFSRLISDLSAQYQAQSDGPASISVFG